MYRVTGGTGLFCAVILCWTLCCTGFKSCHFHYWRTSWHSADRTCRAANKELLCFESKKAIDDITAAFYLSSSIDSELEIWISSRNCSCNDIEQCLSLHIEKRENNVSMPYFQVGCDPKYPFICCSIESETTTTTESFPTSTTANLSSRKTSVVIHSSTTRKDDHVCKGTFRRGILWPDTAVGDVAVQNCPGNSVGNATWSCNASSDGIWNPRGPDLRQCRSLNFMKFKEKLNSSLPSEAIDSLVEVFADRTQEIFGEDLSDLLSLMTSLPDLLHTELISKPADTRWKSTKEAVEKSASVVDHLMELNSTWRDIHEDRRAAVASKMLSIAENFALLMANAMNSSLESIIRNNMGLQIVKPEHGQLVRMPRWLETNSYEDKGTIVLQKGYDSQLDPKEGDTAVIFLLYKDLRNVLSQQDEQDNKDNGILNSAILSATVSQNGKCKPINGQVEIVVENLLQNPNYSACVFWNLHRNEWDTKGCRLQSSNATHTTCVCNHLTNFAVLMDFKGVLGDLDPIPFFYITVIGCSISIVSLSICVFFFTCYSLQSRHAWGLRYSIHRNLCLTLLIANIVLVAGLDKTQNKTACALVAGLLHYFFLSAFSWMLLEGVHIYLLLVIVFASRKSHWEKYYLFGYGFPLIIVFVTAVSRSDYYGTKTTCWLAVEEGTIWAFNGPVAAILLVNSAALFLAQWKASKMTTKEDNVILLKRWLRVTFILFPILGITWLFGFLYVGKHFAVNAYIFALLNSLQGFCIFVFHCLMDQKARGVFMASIRKKRASILTGSSGTQRRQKEKDPPRDAQPSQSSDSSQNSFISRTIYQPMRKAYKHDWMRWRRPWSFCFDLPVSDDGQVPKRNSESQELPNAIVLQWNTIPESAIL